MDLTDYQYRPDLINLDDTSRHYTSAYWDCQLEKAQTHWLSALWRTLYFRWYKWHITSSFIKMYKI